MSFYCGGKENCVIHADSADSFVSIVLSSHDARRFVKYVELVKHLLYIDERYDWTSTHHRLDMFLVQLWKLISISKKACEVWLPGKIVNCYELFYLKRLEDVLQLAEDFKDETRRIRKMIHNTIGYVVNSVLDDILYSHVKYSLIHAGEEILIGFTHYFNRGNLEVDVDIELENGLYSIEIDLGSEYKKLSRRVNNPRDLLPELLVKRSIRYALKRKRQIEESVRA